ncbi:HopJ type III effector protein [Vibrio cyclitrophicus]|uniref:HopJ type III effector protein n=1 Tax=Vibrio TaxID=662 RepID=UPI000C852465|nr:MULTISPECIES: HopJ type III effector protein [Vibrio]MBE8556516.1 HopJ type III effector protein [Vibrio sp. OPT24]PMH56298.1 type III effector [Vibrio cyclitrophicus]PMK98135.1 type III effector [Vibrio cyclitrophicus]
MELETFLENLKQAPESVQFEDTMQVIEASYDFSESEFRNGDVVNAAGQNNGSCKIFAFGLALGLSVDQTLACFGQFYRNDVLDFPENTDHQNIRNFMIHGWGGVEFSLPALVAKAK